uniref:C2H2-type domain-containing protein n=1 Tax=Pseudo-nitzschia australis TaxID=44445 RepID=A0A7S4EJT3_9STRA
MIQSRKRRAFYKAKDRRQAKIDDSNHQTVDNNDSPPLHGNRIVLPPSVLSRSERSRSNHPNNSSNGNDGRRRHHKYFCHQCNAGFQRQKNLKEHLDGRKHKKVVLEWESAARDYASEAPSWRHRTQPTRNSNTNANNNAIANTNTNTTCQVATLVANANARPAILPEQQRQQNHDAATNETPNETINGDTNRKTNNSIDSNNNGINDDDDVDDDIDVRSSWKKTEFKDFPHRSSCIDHSLLISTLSPQLRARFWRYLRDTFGDHYPELASIFHHASVHYPQYMRVKELFENLEAFRIVSRIVLLSQEQDSSGAKNKHEKRNNNGNDNDVNNSRTTNKKGRNNNTKNIDVIYDLACGHGLLGILLAYRFPTKKVVCVDLQERESFYAFKEAFVTKGEAYRDQPTILSNLQYLEADMRSLEQHGNNHEHDATATTTATAIPLPTPSSFLVAVHACNEANKYVVEMAKNAGATWAVMPCCIRSKLYLNGAPIMDVDSQVRYQLLCGAFAEANNASVIRSVPRDVTARPILIAGGFNMAANNNKNNDIDIDDDCHPAARENKDGL